VGLSDPKGSSCETLPSERNAVPEAGLLRARANLHEDQTVIGPEAQFVALRRGHRGQAEEWQEH
jgi:hypothetical protein